MRSAKLTLISSLLALAGLACDRANGESQLSEQQPPQAQAQQECKPLETRNPNAGGQEPAFAGQTRACGVKSNVRFDVVVVAEGLVNPWAVEPLPGGDLLVTEKPGRMRIVSAAGAVGAPLTGLPRIEAGGQGGLLDVALSPSFATDRTIFWSYTEPRQGGNGTSVARGVLSADRRSVEQVRVIFRALPTYTNSMHFGSRLAFSSDGKLFISTGERSDRNMRQHAQRLDNHLGKILRINPDGTVPQDNPFVGQANAKPEVWSLGHRNTQAMAFDADGRLWNIEHGANGGDELNLIEKGKNYGWPVQAYGEEYSGRDIASAETQRSGMQQPVYYWDPVIAPSGAQFYTGNAFPAWRGSLFIGALGQQRLVRVTLRNNRVTGEEHLLMDRNQRVRDVRQGPDGLLYLVTDEQNGEVWKIMPRR
jgi:glucose/arabinose dehydrogenase